MKKCLIYLTVLLVLIGISVVISTCQSTDFPAFYRTAQIILNSNQPAISVYDYSPASDRYDNPRFFLEYKFSLPIAYLISPLALFSYDTAKAIMVFINLIAYLAAIRMTMNITNSKSYILMILFLIWPPFIFNMRLIQINPLILLLITAGVYFAQKEKPYLGGLFLGLSVLFKVFPIAIAMLLGLKNWRIFATSVCISGTVLLIPGTKEWFMSFLYQPFLYYHYSPIYEYNKLVFYIISLIIAIITAFISYRNRNKSFGILASFAIPSMLLTMPVVQYHYLIFIVYTLVYVFSQSNNYPYWFNVCTAISSFIIASGIFYFYLIYPAFCLYVVLLGLLLLWATFAIYLMQIANKQTLVTL